MTIAREKPLLMMDAMAVATLEDRKTVTRRIGPTWATVTPGTRLWVRECFALPKSCEKFSPNDAGMMAIDAGYASPWVPAWFRADDSFNHAVSRAETEEATWGGRGRWRPNIHMPAWLCRIRLEVVSVTPEWADSQWGIDERSAGRPLDDAEGQREGFATWADFLTVWKRMHADYSGPVYRVEFRRLP